MNRLEDYNDNSASEDGGGENYNSTEAPCITPSHSTDTDSLNASSEVVLYGSLNSRRPRIYPFSPPSGCCLSFPENSVERGDHINPVIPHDVFYIGPGPYRLMANEPVVRDTSFPLYDIQGDPLYYQDDGIWPNMPLQVMSNTNLVCGTVGRKYHYLLTLNPDPKLSA
jgi:hypothetical protein